MSKVKVDLTLSLKAEVSAKYDCLVGSNSLLLLSTGQKKYLNELTLKQVDAEVEKGKLKGILEVKAPAKTAAKETPAAGK
jgi:hypothetical protein